MESWKGFAYTALIVFGYLVRGNKVLIVRRANEPYKGQRTVPGGRKQRGETLREALVREMEEETGCRVRSMEYAGMLHALVEGRDMEYLSVYFISRDFEGGAPRQRGGDRRVDGYRREPFDEGHAPDLPSPRTVHPEGELPGGGICADFGRRQVGVQALRTGGTLRSGRAVETGRRENVDRTGVKNRGSSCEGASPELFHPLG